MRFRFRTVFHLRVGIWDLLPRQCPWAKIIQQNQAAAIFSRAVALHPREIREQSKLKSRAQRQEEVVLVTRQNVTRPQMFQRGEQSCARIGQRHA